MNGKPGAEQDPTDRGETAAPVSFGTLLRTYRLAARISLEALAERSRMSAEAISALERGARRAPRPDTIALLVDALRLTQSEQAELEAAAGEARTPRAAAAEPPDDAPAPIATPPHNLPLPLTTFYGREDDLVALTQELIDHRLVTIAGFAGIGKTRLAIAAGWRLLDRFPDGVFLVELAPVADAGLVASRIATALGIPAQTGQLSGDLWIDGLREKSTLLVLDNCEHVLDAVVETTQRLLQRCPYFRVLATSREPLRMPGERILRITPLALPSLADDDLAALKAIRNAPSVSLFLDRVSDTAPGFALADNDAAGWTAISNVVNRLDGIPLALELAAARVSTLGLPTLERGLDDRFRLLKGGSRTSLPRHRTLEATLDWSYAVLAEDEQRVFNRLGVFAGTFSGEAAAAVCASEKLDEQDVQEILGSLVDKSLVVVDGAATPRYRLLETTRAYALRRVLNDPDPQSARRRHAQHYHELSFRARGQFGRVSFAEWAETYRLELDNFRAALTWALDDRGDVKLGAEIVCNLNRLMDWLSLHGEILTWCRRAAAALAGDASPELEAELALVTCRHHAALGELHAAIEPGQRAAALFRQLGARMELAYAYTFVSRPLSLDERTRPGADRDLDEARSIFRDAQARAAADARQIESQMPNLLMSVLADTYKTFTIDRADIAGRRAWLTGGLESFRAIAPSHYIIGTVLELLSELELEGGNYAAAVEHGRAGVASFQRPGSAHVGYNWALNAAATAALMAGDVDAARADAGELLSFARRIGSAPGLAMALLLLAAVEASERDPVIAGGLLGAFENAAGKIDATPLTTKLLCERTYAALRAKLDEKEIEGAVAAGKAWSVEDAINVAQLVAENR